MDHEILDRPVRRLLSADEAIPVPIFVQYVKREDQQNATNTVTGPLFS